MGRATEGLHYRQEKLQARQRHHDQVVQGSQGDFKVYGAPRGGGHRGATEDEHRQGSEECVERLGEGRKERVGTMMSTNTLGSIEDSS